MKTVFYEGQQWVAQHHDELAHEQVVLDAQMTEKNWRKAVVGTERAAAIDYTVIPRF
jgi:hypothetical protein